MYNDKCNKCNTCTMINVINIKKCTTLGEIFSLQYICICRVDQCKFNTKKIVLSYILRRNKKIKLI